MNLDSLKLAAQNRWPEIVSRLASVDIESLDGKHHPCPSGRCGSTTDAFRFTNMQDCGSAICSQCGKFGDGFATLQWLLGIEFKEAAAKVAEYLGVEFDGKKQKAAKEKFRKPIDCLTLLQAPGTREAFAKDFAAAKPGIEVETLLRCRWAAALWPRGGSSEMQVKVLAFVTYRLPHLTEHSFIIYRRNGRHFAASQKVDKRKTHILGGSATGNKDGMFIAGTPDEFRAAKRCYKCEGITDAIALAPILGNGEIAIANVCGGGSCDWVDCESFDHFEEVVIVADNDESSVGLSGANKFAGLLL